MDVQLCTLSSETLHVFDLSSLTRTEPKTHEQKHTSMATVSLLSLCGIQLTLLGIQHLSSLEVPLETNMDVEDQPCVSFVDHIPGVSPWVSHINVSLPLVSHP